MCYRPYFFTLSIFNLKWDNYVIAYVTLFRSIFMMFITIIAIFRYWGFFNGDSRDLF